MHKSPLPCKERSMRFCTECTIIYNCFVPVFTEHKTRSSIWKIGSTRFSIRVKVTWCCRLVSDDVVVGKDNYLSQKITIYFRLVPQWNLYWPLTIKTPSLKTGSPWCVSNTLNCDSPDNRYIVEYVQSHVSTIIWLCVLNVSSEKV